MIPEIFITTQLLQWRRLYCVCFTITKAHLNSCLRNEGVTPEAEDLMAKCSELLAVLHTIDQYFAHFSKLTGRIN